MKCSERGKELIKEFEGCILKPYKDAVGLWTIGVGHLIKEGENFGSITIDEAMELLAKDLQWAEACINNTGVELTQNQFDALCSLVFNIGCGAFQGSTLLRKLKAGENAASEFLRWNKAGGVVLKGLTRRREAEMRLFLGEESD